METRARTLIHAGMVLDGTGRRHAPGAILVEDGAVIASGSPQEIGAVSGVRCRVSGSEKAWAQSTDTCHQRPETCLIPALVNAHAHLDLSHIGPVPYTGDFISWVDLVSDRRAITPESIAEAVHHGAKLSLAGGTAIIGDIAGVGSLTAAEALRESPLTGVSYIELFGQGPPERQAAALAIIQSIAEMTERDQDGVRLGLQPHAPYSCARSVYEAAVNLHSALSTQHSAPSSQQPALPLATHLAETLEELEFVRRPHGSALAGLLAARGAWHDSIAAYDCHPIDALADIFAQTPFVAAHLNYVEDRHIELLSLWPITVAYCPRASAYFGHPRRLVEMSPPHRYRDMLSAGVNVALGTDSILCLDTPDRISVLDEMRFLYRRDETDPMSLLRMATINGAAALGFDQSLVTFDEGPIAGILALPFDPNDEADPLAQVLLRDDAPEWVVAP